MQTDVLSVSSADLCEYLQKDTEFYSNKLTVQLVLCVKYLPCYSKHLIYITAVHLLISRATTFHYNQSTTVPVSVIQMDTSKHNSGTGAVQGIAGQ